MCTYMPDRGNNIDNDKAVKSPKRKGIMRYDSYNIFKARNYKIQHKNMTYRLIANFYHFKHSRGLVTLTHNFTFL